MSAWNLRNIPVECGGGWEISHENGYTEITSEDPAYVILLLENNEAKAQEIKRLKDEVEALRAAFEEFTTHRVAKTDGDCFANLHVVLINNVVILESKRQFIWLSPEMLRAALEWVEALAETVSP